MEIAGHLVSPWRLVAAGAYLALGAAVLVVVWPGRQTRPAAPPPPSPAVALRFPAPPPGATVFAREAGAEVLAAAVAADGSKLRIQVSIVGAQGGGATGRSVTIGGRDAVACGAGCYRAVVPAAATVPISTGGTTWRLGVPASVSPGAALVARAERTWRALRSVSWRETLGSDSTHVVRSRWIAQAPDRVAYVVEQGGSSVVIGNRRWDRANGGAWRRGAQDPPIHQPVPFWTSATNARVVARSGGHAVVSFYDPGTPGWFRIVVNTRTGRTLRLDMVATAHFMHDRYERFDTSAVVPPR